MDVNISPKSSSSNTFQMIGPSEVETKTNLMEIVNFVSMIHEFFGEVKTFDDGTKFLKRYMKHKIQDYSLNTSRKIFYSLMIYKFGKELEYPETLQTKSRNLILFYLQRNHKETLDDSKSDTLSGMRRNSEEKRLLKEFVEELENYKLEDLKNYMYELAIEYNQLSEILSRVSDHPEWFDAITGLQDKIVKQVDVVKGEHLFKECLETIGKLKKEIIKEHLVNAYWEMMKEELEQNKYDMMMKNYVLIKNILLEMREDNDTKEILDENYIRQLLDNDLFNNQTLVSQVEFIFNKIKLYGIPIYDKIIDRTKKNLIQDIQQRGIGPSLVVDVFKKTVSILHNYIEIIRIYRKKIRENK